MMMSRGEATMLVVPSFIRMLVAYTLARVVGANASMASPSASPPKFRFNFMVQLSVSARSLMPPNWPRRFIRWRESHNIISGYDRTDPDLRQGPRLERLQD